MKLSKKSIANLTYPIRLGQFLKFVNVAQDGQEAKTLIKQGMILVNGKIDKRRGKQLHEGDTVEVRNSCIYLLQ